VNTPTNHGCQNKWGTLGSLNLGPEKEEHGRSAITANESFSMTSRCRHGHLALLTRLRFRVLDSRISPEGPKILSNGQIQQ
jgi:hypothetical protein